MEIKINAIIIIKIRRRNKKLRRVNKKLNLNQLSSIRIAKEDVDEQFYI
jgi:hypothetical protein